MTHQQILKHLGKVVDPSSKLTLEETKSITNLVINPDGVIEVEAFIKNKEKDEREVKIALTKVIKQDLGFPGAKIEIYEFEKEPPKYKYLGVASGKGGVGKSTVTANLAKAFNRLGIKTGIIDSDIYGASIPFIMDIEKETITGDDKERMIPLQKEGVEVMSTEFFMPDDTPLMWRGPLLAKLLKHFFTGVSWDSETKLVLIDMPPGTGDVAIDMSQFAPQADMIIVTTPNINASKVAVKAGLGAMQVGHDVLGVVENMSYYHNYANNKKDYIFGTGGAKEVASKLGVEILGQIPIVYKEDKDLIEKEYDKIAKRLKEILKL